VEAVRTSETSASFCESTRRNILDEESIWFNSGRKQNKETGFCYGRRGTV
jgi:hypothetical protein